MTEPKKQPLNEPVYPRGEKFGAVPKIPVVAVETSAPVEPPQTDYQKLEKEALSSVQQHWLVWSIEHNAWWDADRCGYTKDRAKAGRYSFNDATFICLNANQYSNKLMEAMVPENSDWQGA
jgi:hypothetical protein